MSFDNSFYSSYSDASTDQLFVVDSGNNKNNLLPPLLQAVDTYVDSVSDAHVQQLNESAKSVKKKMKGRKTKKKASKQLVPEVKPIPPTVLIAGDLSSGSDRPESRGFASSREGNPLPLYQLGRHTSAWEEVPPAVSLDAASSVSNSKNSYLDGSSTVYDHSIKLFPISPPNEANFNKSKFSPHSPHRSINANTGPLVKRDNFLSPVIPGKSNVYNKLIGQSSPANKKADLGFHRALQSIAAIKLHNFAMRRRNHVTQKLKLLREIRGLQKEQAEEVAVAIKVQEEEEIIAKKEQEEESAAAMKEQEEAAAAAKKEQEDEALAAWKLRYYIEYLRLNTMRHVVNVVEERNQELESELDIARRSLSTTHSTLDALREDMTKTYDDAMEREREKNMIREQLMRVSEELQITRNHVFVMENSIYSERVMQEDLRNSLRNEYSKSDMIRNQLNITRLTCQDLVMNTAQKDNELYQLKAELRDLRMACDDEKQRRLDIEVMTSQQAESFRMKEEDSMANIVLISQLNNALNMKDGLLDEQNKQIVQLKCQLAESNERLDFILSTNTSEKETIQNLEEEKAALQKLLTDTARKANLLETRVMKHCAKEVELQAGLTTKDVILDVHQRQLAQEQAQYAEAQNQIKASTEEKIALSIELERLNMQSEELYNKYVSTCVLSNRHGEYSRFLEEELFNARKLYETKSDDFYMTQLYKNTGDAGISEESYFYRKQKFDSEKEQVDIDTPVLYYLKSFGKGSPPQGHQRKPTTTPTTPPPIGSGGSEYYDADYSPSHNLVAEQRLILVLDALENKLKSVDEAANSLRFLAEKADIINKQGFAMSQSSDVNAPTTMSFRTDSSDILAIKASSSDLMELPPVDIITQEQMEYDQIEQERIERERIERERVEHERIERERIERERIELERIERERIERERIERERIEQERIEQERIERERIERERIERERIERERIELERIERERIEQERIERERIEQERIERERIERERVEQERLLLEQRRLKIQEQRLALLEEDRVGDVQGRAVKSQALIEMTVDQREHLLNHMEMENMFYSLQAELESINLTMTSQQEEIIALEDEKAFFKDRMKSLKKNRRKSIKMNALNDAEEQSASAEISQYSEQIDLIRDRISMYSTENMRLNDRAIEVQTELHDLDMRLEFSANDFFNKYGIDIMDESLRSSVEAQFRTYQQKPLEPQQLNPSPIEASFDPIFSQNRFQSEIASSPKPSVAPDDMSRISSLGFDDEASSIVKKSKKKKKGGGEDANNRKSLEQPNTEQAAIISMEPLTSSGLVVGTNNSSADKPIVKDSTAAIQRNTVPEPTEDEITSASDSGSLASNKKNKKSKKDRSRTSRPSVVQELPGGSIDDLPAMPPSTNAVAVNNNVEAKYANVTLDQFPFSTNADARIDTAPRTTSTTPGTDRMDSSKPISQQSSDVESVLPTSSHSRRGNMINSVGVVAAVKTPNRNLRDIKLAAKNRYDIKDTPKKDVRETSQDVPTMADKNPLPVEIVTAPNAVNKVPDNLTPQPIINNDKGVDELQLDEMRKEYAQVKESLNTWKQGFIATYNREPTTDDFTNVDVSVQLLILRKDELSQLLAQSKSRRKSTMKSPRRESRKSISTSIASESITPVSISSQGVASERMDQQPDESLLAEYEDIKQKLSQWKQNFIRKNNREPSTDDFVNLDIGTQMMILRRDELKQLVSGMKEKKRSSKNKGTVGLDVIEEVAVDVQSVTQTQASADGDALNKPSGTRVTEDRTANPPSVGATPTKALKRVDVSELYNKVDLLSELSSIKKTLSQWRRDFLTNNGRDPEPSDFLTMSPSMQALMVRREDIKVMLSNESEKRVTIVNQDSIYSDGSSRPLDYNPDRDAGKITEKLVDKKKNKDRKKNQMDNTDMSSLASEVSDITAEDDFRYKRDSAEYSVDSPSKPLVISNSTADQPSASAAVETVVAAPVKTTTKGKKTKKKGVEDGGDGGTLASAATKSTVATDDDPLRKEYQDVKKYLKRWKADFAREHGREPDNRDLETVDAETQRNIVRQFELKEAIDERDRKAAQDELLKKSIKSALHTYHE